MPAVTLTHFSDILCIWAYIGDANVARVNEKFGSSLAIDVHFCSVFPDTQTKITKAWANRGGFDGYADHVHDVASRIDIPALHKDVWRTVRPRSSASPRIC